MRHDGYSIERMGYRVRALCTCGWRSETLASGGLAGAAWDVHVGRDPSPFPPAGRFTSLDRSDP